MSSSYVGGKDRSADASLGIEAHTPGRGWRVWRGRKHEETNVFQDGKTVVEDTADGATVAVAYCHYGTAERSEKHARMIAAAPELLEALNAVPSESDFPNAAAYREAIAVWWQAWARPAINKAEGRSS